MRRVALLLCLFVVLPLFGLTRPMRRGDRIGVLRAPDEYAYQAITKAIAKDLRAELQSRGFHTFSTDVTFNELQQGDGAPADYYVEVVSSSAAGREYGAAGAAVGPVVVDVAVESSEVAAEVRLYDGRTLELLDRYELQRKQTTAVPAGVGIGTRSIWAAFALPFVRDAQFRARAHDIAREAAARIADR